MITITHLNFESKGLKKVANIKLFIFFRVLIFFTVPNALCAMDRAERVRIFINAVPLGMGSPTFIERILRDAGVPADQLAQQIHAIYFGGAPLPIPYESVAELLHRLRPERVIRNVGQQSCERRWKVLPKIKKRSD